MKGVNFYPKRCGEIAELAFAFKACGMGFVVSKPYGDSAAYDFVVGAKKHLRRVQVKSTSSPGFGRYKVGVQHFHGRGGHAYTREEIDFVVAYIVPRNIWYVVPSKAVLKTKGLAGVSGWKPQVSVPKADANLGHPAGCFGERCGER